jgi:hypothetical protein
MSRTPSGIRSTRASSSLVEPPNRPETVALPPANVRAVGARRQASPSRVRTAAAGEPEPAGGDVRDRVEDEVAAPCSGDTGHNPAGAAAQLPAGVEAGDRERAAAEAARRQRSLERSPRRVEQGDAFEPAGADDDRRRPREAGIVGSEVDGDPLDAAPGVEGEAPGEPAALDAQSPGEAAGVGAERAEGTGVGDEERGHLDEGRAVLGQQDRAVRGERPEVRSSRRAIGVAGGGGIEVEKHVGQAKRFVRAGEADGERRPLDPPVEVHREGAVGPLHALALEEKGAVAAAVAGARDPDLRRGDDKVAQVQDEVVAAQQVGLQRGEAPGQPREELVVEPPHPGPRLAGDERSLAARVRHDLQLGRDVDDAEARDEVAGHPARHHDVEAAGDQVDEQADLALELIRAEGEAFAGQSLAGDPEQPLDPEVGENSAGDVADAGDPASRHDERHRHRRPREAAAPLRPDVLETGCVEGHSGTGQAVGEGEAPEGSVEQGDEADLLPGHVREQGGRAEQVRAEAKVAESASGKVDDPGGHHRHRRRAKRQPPRQLPILQSRPASHLDGRRRQPGFLAGPELGGRDPSRQAVAAAVRSKAKVRRAAAGEVQACDAVPRGPAALALYRQDDRPFRPEHRPGDSPSGGGELHVEIEPVAVGLRVEEEREPVAAVAHVRLEADEGPAGADVRLADEARHPRLAGHRAADPHLRDPQAADMDVEAGQDRARPLAGPKLRQAVERGQTGIEPVDDQAVGDPAERLPVDVDQRRFREQPLRVVEPDVAKPSVAPDRSLDPADMDPEARAGRGRRDPVGDEAVAGGGVEEHRQRRGKHRQRQRDRDDGLGEAGGPAPPSATGRRGFVTGHQKA